METIFTENMKIDNRNRWLLLFLLYNQFILDRSASLHIKCQSCGQFSSKEKIIIGQSVHSHVGGYWSQTGSVLDISELHQHPIINSRLDGELVEVLQPDTNQVITEGGLGVQILQR